MTNEGTPDRVVRVVAGAALGFVAWKWLGVTDVAPLGIAAGVVAGVFVITGVVGFCPAYRLIGFKTCKLKSE